MVPFGGADGSSYQLKGFYRCDEPEADDTDRWALDNGYVAITPTQTDVTAYDAMDGLKQIYE